MKLRAEMFGAFFVSPLPCPSPQESGRGALRNTNSTNEGKNPALKRVGFFFVLNYFAFIGFTFL